MHFLQTESQDFLTALGRKWGRETERGKVGGEGRREEKRERKREKEGWIENGRGDYSQRQYSLSREEIMSKAP